MRLDVPVIGISRGVDPFVPSPVEGMECLGGERRRPRPLEPHRRYAGEDRDPAEVVGEAQQRRDGRGER